MKTVIFTDSCCDLSIDYVRENNIEVMPLTVNIDSTYVTDDLGQSIKHKDFYDLIRRGEMPSTSTVNAFAFEEKFREYVNNGYSIIYIGFSSALSGCVNSANIAKGIVEDDIKNADITVVDTKSASLGLGLLVYKASEMLKNGANKEEIVNWLEENKLKVNHWFTVDDLNHLKRGGRVSSTSAMVGTLLSIKPIMNVSDEGKLTPVAKVKGRKKSIKHLQEMLKERITNPEEQVIFISHGDCLNEAEKLKDMILENTRVKEVKINYVGPTIGSHSGPGTLALFFLGNER